MILVLIIDSLSCRDRGEVVVGEALASSKRTRGDVYSLSCERQTIVGLRSRSGLESNLTLVDVSRESLVCNDVVGACSTDDGVDNIDRLVDGRILCRRSSYGRERDVLAILDARDSADSDTHRESAVVFLIADNCSRNSERRRLDGELLAYSCEGVVAIGTRLDGDSGQASVAVVDVGVYVLALVESDAIEGNDELRRLVETIVSDIVCLDVESRRINNLCYNLPSMRSVGRELVVVIAEGGSRSRVVANRCSSVACVGSHITSIRSYEVSNICCYNLLSTIVGERRCAPCESCNTLLDGEGEVLGRDGEVAALDVRDGHLGGAGVGVVGVGDAVLGCRDGDVARLEGDGGLMGRAVVGVGRRGEVAGHVGELLARDGEGAVGGNNVVVVGICSCLRRGGKGIFRRAYLGLIACVDEVEAFAIDKHVATDGDGLLGEGCSVIDLGGGAGEGCDATTIDEVVTWLYIVERVVLAVGDYGHLDEADILDVVLVFRVGVLVLGRVLGGGDGVAILIDNVEVGVLLLTVVLELGICRIEDDAYIDLLGDNLPSVGGVGRELVVGVAEGGRGGSVVADLGSRVVGVAGHRACVAAYEAAHGCGDRLLGAVVSELVG